MRDELPADTMPRSPTPGPTPPPSRFVPELDGLRCLAVASVLLWHGSLRVDRITAGLVESGAGRGLYGLVPHGEVGVILFFVISGFLVSRSFDVGAVPSWDVGRFYLKRLLRLYPPYLVALLGCFVVLAVVGHVPVDANTFSQASGPSLGASLAAGLLYLNGIAFDAPSRLNPPMWSLEVEVQFYAALPLVMLGWAALAPRRHGRLVAGLAACALLGAIAWCSSFNVDDVRSRWGLLYHAPFLLTGVALAQAGVGRGARRALGDAAFAAGAAALVAVGYSMTANDAHLVGSGYALGIEVASCLAGAAMLWGGLNGVVASRLLRIRGLRAVGVMCYSIYLTHIVVMQAIAEVVPRLVRVVDLHLAQAVLLVVIVAVPVGTGWAFFRLVERPSARLGALFPWLARPTPPVRDGLAAGSRGVA